MLAVWWPVPRVGRIDPRVDMPRLPRAVRLEPAGSEVTADERDPREVRRELRIQRAVVGLVLHGYRGDTVGFNSAATELARVEQATPDELFRPLLWASCVPWRGRS